MNPQQIENDHQQEYETRVMLFTTNFRNNFCVAPMSGFNPKRFVGTRKDYDKNMSKYYQSESYGKVIGVNSEPFIDERTEEQKETAKKIDDPNFNPFAMLQDTPENREIYKFWKRKPRKKI